MRVGGGSQVKLREALSYVQCTGQFGLTSGTLKRIMYIKCACFSGEIYP